MNEFIEDIKQFNNNARGFGEEMGKIWYYLIHPKNLTWLLWCGAVKYSLIICLTIFFAGLILNVFGIRKGALWAKVSFLSFLTIQIFNAAIR